MITEDYCSFEVAKLLKEKGFDKVCHAMYNRNKYLIPINFPRVTKSEKREFVLDAPTHQKAMKWLREEKGIAIVPILSSVLDNERFLWNIEITVAKTNETYHQGWIYESYERACEAGIKYCLKNLI